MYTSYNDFLYHHGVKGMKWGVRRYENDARLRPSSRDTKITRQVKKDWHDLDDKQFYRKYAVNKKTYAKRVIRSKTGDPFADRRAKMSSKNFDKNVEAEARWQTSANLANKGDAYNAKRSTQSKVAVGLSGAAGDRYIRGQKLGTSTPVGVYKHAKRANEAYGVARAANISKLDSVGAVTVAGSRATIDYANNKYINSKEGKRNYKRTKANYYK